MLKHFYKIITLSLIIVFSLNFILINNSFVYADKFEIEKPDKYEETKSLKNPNETLSSGIDIHLGEDGLVKLTKDKNVDNTTAWKIFIKRYKSFVVGIAAFAAVTMVLLFIKNFLKLGAVASNPQARSETLKGLLVTGIATGLLGSVALITALFYNTLK